MDTTLSARALLVHAPRLSRKQDLNLRPSDYKSGAPPAVLFRQKSEAHGLTLRCYRYCPAQTVLTLQGQAIPCLVTPKSKAVSMFRPSAYGCHGYAKILLFHHFGQVVYFCHFEDQHCRIPRMFGCPALPSR